MSITIDIEVLRRLLLRNCNTALEAFGFDLQPDSPPVEIAFLLNESNEVTGVEINQSINEAAPA